jgi:formiminoglutamase
VVPTIPHTQPAAWPSNIPTSRLAAHFHASPVGCRVALLGLPDDEGVRLNNGRPGAKDGPRALREALAGYGVAAPESFQWPRIFDAGDVIPGEDIQETHGRVTQATAAILEHGLVPIAIGGGHDLTFPFVRAVASGFRPMHNAGGAASARPAEPAAARKAPALAGIYFDAHLDVRNTVGSGMPFRSLVEHCGVRELHVFGLNHFANTHEHMEWFKANGGHVHNSKSAATAAGLPLQLPTQHPCFVSFDMDVLDASVAPGVSAMNPSGWTVAQAEPWLLASGRSDKVRCFDIMELNPAHDEGGRTARVGAHLLLTFLRGFSERHA